MRRTYILLLLLLTGVCIQAQEQKGAKSLLWKISGNGIQKPSYLFGTIHIICKDDYIWTNAMSKSLKQCDEICMEMDMDDPNILTKIAYAMVETNGKKLEEYFSTSDYKLVEKYFRDSLSINIEMFATMKPIVLQTLLTTTSFSCDSSVSYEVKLSEYAKANKVEVSGLETPEEQIKLLEQIPVDSIILDLVATAKGVKNDDTIYKAMIDAYIHQDLPQLYELILKAKEEGDNMNVFLDERNQKWIDRMTEHMEQKSVFFAVGAGHLWGENGLINLLRQNGYTVQAQN